MKNTFVVEWIGPFECREDLKQWEQSNNKNKEYSIYIVTGKRKSERNDSAYCGITHKTENDFVFKRFNNAHKSNDFVRDKNIWIGKFANYDSSVMERDLVELCETMIISYWQPKANDKKKAFYPKEPVVLINRWYRLVNEKFILRKQKRHKAQELPDVIVYNEVDKGIYIAKNLQLDKERKFE